jgi:NADH:ubiquinone oxidoreductase subunit K
VLLRWLAAGVLVAALVGLQRRGLSIVRGRKAVAIWLLAALLHGPAVARSIEGLGEPALPGFVATLTQIATASAATVGLALLLAWIRRRRVGIASESFHVPVSRLSIGLSPTYGFVRFTPRPPPGR